jgi:hypothetical protein
MKQLSKTQRYMPLKRYGSLIQLLITLLPLPSHAISTLHDNLIMSATYPEDGVILGQGWDMVSGNKTNTVCITGTEEKIDNNTSTVNYELLYDEEQLSKLLDISARASYGGYGYSASIESTYKKLNLTDRNRTHILGRAITDKGGTFLVSTKNNIIRNLINFNSVGFRKKCGDGFVSAIKKGGQLNIIFDMENINNSTTEALGVKLEAGGFGSSAGLSISQEAISKVINKDTRISSIQTGGVHEFPTSAEGIKDKISKFTDFQPEKATPYKIIITPYSKLYNTKTLINITAISAYYFEYQRLLTLANLYNAALIQKEMFYQPFYKPDEMVNITKSLNIATRCMEFILARCLNNDDTKNCNILNQKSKNDEILKVCNISNDKQSLLASIVLNKTIKIPSHSLVNSTTEKKPDLIEALLSPTAFTPNIASKETNKSTKNNNEASNDKEITPFDLYYMLYARAPLAKKIEKTNTNNNVSTQLNEGDEMLAAYRFCEDSGNGCIKTQAVDDVKNKEKLTLVKGVILNWVLNVRLAPLSSTFCKISLQHYMCATNDWLRFYLPGSDTITLDETAGFDYTIVSTPEPRKNQDEVPYDPKIGECDWQSCK